MKNSFIEPIDVFFAKTLLDKQEEKGSNVSMFLQTLMALSRLGHTCVPIEEKKLFLIINALDPLFAKSNLDSVLNGAKQISTEICSFIHTGKENNILMRPLCFFDEHYYLQKNYVFESIFCNQIKGRLQVQEDYSIDFSKAASYLKTVASKIKSEQSSAIEKALQTKFSLLEGGPGTGKTYLAAFLIQTYFASVLNPDKKKVLLAAPTGKAASHLLQKIQRNVDAKYHDQILSGTLHSLLKIREGKNPLSENLVLDADFIIVDESSMLDLALFTKLVSSSKKEAKLFCMGDPAQLPSIETGSVFKSLCEFCMRMSPKSYSKLQICMRSDLTPILEIAKALQKGSSHFENYLFRAKDPISYFSLPESLQSLTQNPALENAIKHFPKASFAKLIYSDLFENYYKYGILSCLKVGKFGTDSLNRMMFSKLASTITKEKILPVPIIITKTCYQTGLFNGEIGFLLQSEDSSQDVAVFELQEQNLQKQYKTLPKVLLPSYEYAYAVSVHKSQGSEYDNVVVIVPDSIDHFGKEILYTAITRAKKSLSIFGNMDKLVSCVNKSSDRCSRLEKKLLS